MSSLNTHISRDLTRIYLLGKKGNPAFGGTIPISGPHENTHYDGLMLIGDAADSPPYSRAVLT